MSKQTENNLFILSPLAAKYGGLYQRLFSGIASFKELGNRITREIEAAHAFRQTEKVRELSRILINIPIREYQLIAQYYLAWCECRESKYEAGALEQVIDQSRTYKVKALLSRGALEGRRSDLRSALYFYTEALKAKPSLSEYVTAIRSISFIKSLEGFHKSALKDLERLMPVLRYSEPLAFYDYLNSYAVELGEVGRKQEARNVIRHVLTSPFIHAYPEWQETAQELKEPNRSFVAVPSIEPVEIEAIEAQHVNESEQLPSVVVFPKLKEAPEPQKPDRLSPQELRSLTLNEKRELVLAAIRTGIFTASDYDKFIVMVGLLEAGPADEIVDLEDDETLRDIMIVWAHQIEPEELAAVLSALRDCENDKRRNDIIDRMIRIAFEETQECGLNEEEWRLRVERRLPKK